MSLNFKHIAEGWAKSIGLWNVTDDVKKLSMERMNVCATSGENGGQCEFARESNFLKLLHGSANDIPAIYCSLCTCPINEKSLVTDEKCPKSKW